MIRLLLAKLDWSKCRMRGAATIAFVCAAMLWHWSALAQTKAAPAAPTLAPSGVVGVPAANDFQANQSVATQGKAAGRDSLNTPFERVIRPILARQHFAQSGARKPLLFQEAKDSGREAQSGDGAGPVNLNFPGFYGAPSIFAAAPADTFPLAVSVTGDFNKDGKPDIATINEDGTVTVVLNGGSANILANGISYSDTSEVSRLPLITFAVAADMNGDGYTDIVGMDSLNSAIVLWINNGNGGFLPATVVPVFAQNGASFTLFNAGLGVGGGGIAVGDVNGDGIPDVVAVSFDSVLDVVDQDTVNVSIATQVFAGDGKGHLEPPTEVDSPGFVGIGVPPGQNVQLADMNNDGNLDIVLNLGIQRINDFVTRNEDFVVLELNNGGGNFAPFSLGGTNESLEGLFPDAGISHVEIADVNGDGNLDVVWSFGGGLFPTGIGVAFGDGAGNLAAPVDIGIFDASANIFHLADVNGDGKLDLVTYGAGSIDTFLGNGDGTFSTYPVTVYASSNNAAMQEPAVEDYNGDGKPDVIYVDAALETASFYGGNGDGSFQAAGAVYPGGTNPSNLLIVGSGDLNGDGIPDLVGVESLQGSGLTASGVEVVSLLSDGKGGFQQVIGITNATLRSIGALAIHDLLVYATSVVDLNGDGLADVVLATPNGIYTALSNGDGTIQTPVQVPNLTLQCPPNVPDAGNVDGSSHTSLVFAYPGDASCGGTGSVPPGIVVLINDGKGNFTATIQAIGSQPFQARLADLNGDGYADLLLSDINGNTGIYDLYTVPNEGAAASSAGSYFNVAQRNTVVDGYTINDILVGDYNGDGIPDLALATVGQTIGAGINQVVAPGTQGVLLLPGQGGFQFGVPTLVAQGTVPNFIQWADINQDGIPDLVMNTAETAVNQAPVYGMSVLPGLGNGLFAPAVSQVFPSDDAYVFIGDFNQDGASDVVVSGGVSGGFYSGLYLNRGADSLTLSVPTGSVAQGSSVTLTANLKTRFIDFAAAGTVTFTSNGTLLGTATITNGAASFTYNAATAGVYPITATYSGDGHFNQASASGSFAVTALAPALTSTASSTSVNLASGQSDVVTLTLTANPTFNGTVSFTTSASGTAVSVVVNPTTVTLSGGQTQQVSVVIGTGTVSSAIVHESNNVWGRAAATMSLAAFFPLLLFRSRTLRRKLVMVVLLGAGLGCLAGLSGCNNGTPKPATMMTTETVTVTATPSVAGVAPLTTTLTVNVQ